MVELAGGKDAGRVEGHAFHEVGAVEVTGGGLGSSTSVGLVGVPFEEGKTEVWDSKSRISSRWSVSNSWLEPEGEYSQV
jgi:hypothetical protein